MMNYINPTKEEIINYLQQKGYETKDEEGQIRVNRCPFCQDDKIDWTHFYINYKGMYFCHKCSASGNLITLSRHFGDYEKKNISQNNNYIKKPEEVTIEPPAKEIEILKEDQEKMESSAKEYYKNLFPEKPETKISNTAQKILTHLTEKRGFTLDTLKHFKIGWTGTAITIPIIENNKVVNIRFRKSPFDTNKNIPKMLSIKGGKMALFNTDVIKNSKKIVITEGEMDAMSLYQEGWESVVSITCGANTFKKEWAELLKKQNSIYLCYDSDEVGQKGIDVALSRLGAGRCFKITLPKNKQDMQIKDLNDFFAKEKRTIDDFNILYNQAERIKIDYKYIDHIKQAISKTKEFLMSIGKLRGLSTGYPELDKLWRGMRNGDLIVISGDTNVGKTFAALNIILNLANQDIKTLLFSLEQPVEEIVERFMMLDSNLCLEAEINKDKKTAIHKLEQASCDLEKKPIYFYSGYDKVEPKLLGEVIDKAVRDFGCKLVVIDHLHYFATGDRRQRTTEIGDIVRYVKLLARKYSIPIILICHIRKLKEDNIMPTMEDLKDSSAIKQDADIVAILYRKRMGDRQLCDYTVLNTDKNRHGKSGETSYMFGEDCVITEATPADDLQAKKQSSTKRQSVDSFTDSEDSRARINVNKEITL